MKRTHLIDRVAMLLERQEELEKAAHAFVDAQRNSCATAYDRARTRKEHTRAAVALGIALQRYLGGRT